MVRGPFLKAELDLTAWFRLILFFFFFHQRGFLEQNSLGWKASTRTISEQKSEGTKQPRSSCSLLCFYHKVQDRLSLFPWTWLKRQRVALQRLGQGSSHWIDQLQLLCIIRSTCLESWVCWKFRAQSYACLFSSKSHSVHRGLLPGKCVSDCSLNVITCMFCKAFCFFPIFGFITWSVWIL